MQIKRLHVQCEFSMVFHFSYLLPRLFSYLLHRSLATFDILIIFIFSAVIFSIFTRFVYYPARLACELWSKNNYCQISTESRRKNHSFIIRFNGVESKSVWVQFGLLLGITTQVNCREEMTIRRWEKTSLGKYSGQLLGLHMLGIFKTITQRGTHSRSMHWQQCLHGTRHRTTSQICFVHSIAYSRVLSIQLHHNCLSISKTRENKRKRKARMAKML